MTKRLGPRPLTPAPQAKSLGRTDYVPPSEDLGTDLYETVADADQVVFDDPNGWLRDERHLDAQQWFISKHWESPKPEIADVQCPNTGLYWAIRHTTTHGLFAGDPVGACARCHIAPDLLDLVSPGSDREEVEAAIMDHARENDPDFDETVLLPIVWVSA